MKRPVYWTFLLGTILQLSAGLASPATIPVLTLDTLIQKSEYVVYGRTVGTRSFWDPTTNTIWTETELLVLDGAKGRAGKTLVITEPGGVLGDIAHLFPGLPRFTDGEEVVLFLYGAPGNRVRVLGLRQGVYDVVRDPNSGERTVRPSVEPAELMVPDPRVALRSEPGQVKTRRLSEFMASIREKAAHR